MKAPAVDRASRRRSWLARIDDGKWRWVAAAVVLLLLGTATFLRKRGSIAWRQELACFERLRSPFADERCTGAKDLLKLGRRDELVTTLLEWSLAGDPRAMAQLTSVMNERDRQWVREYLDSAGPEARALALRLLRGVATKHDLPRYVRALHHSDARVRAAALEALAGRKALDPRLVAGLTALVQDPVVRERDVERDVFGAEVRASKEVAARVNELLSDSSPDVRAAAADLVASLGR